MSSVQKMATEALAFASEATAAIAAIGYTPNDPASTEEAVAELQATIIRLASAYPDNPMVSSTSEQMKATFEKHFRKRREAPFPS